MTDYEHLFDFSSNNFHQGDSLFGRPGSCNGDDGRLRSDRALSEASFDGQEAQEEPDIYVSLR